MKRTRDPQKPTKVLLPGSLVRTWSPTASVWTYHIVKDVRPVGARFYIFGNKRRPTRYLGAKAIRDFLARNDMEYITNDKSVRFFLKRFFVLLRQKFWVKKDTRPW